MFLQNVNEWNYHKKLTNRECEGKQMARLCMLSSSNSISQLNKREMLGREGR